MEVHGPSSVGASSPISQIRPKANVEQAGTVDALSPRDEVDISSAGRLMDDVSRTTGIRQERLAQIKAAIDSGVYETPEKLETALSRMLAELNRDEKS